MIGRAAQLLSRKKSLLGIAFIVLAAVYVDLYVVGQGLGYRELIVAFSAAIGGVVVLGKERGVRFGFVLWALTLALGYRTFPLMPELAIHPAEILLWLLLACILVQRDLASSASVTLPYWIWLLMPFWVLAWWPLIAGDVPWARMLNEFRNFFLLVPLIIVASVVLQREGYWRHLLLAFFVASTWIALLGVIEYWFPGVAKLFPAFATDPAHSVTAEGFARATFSFYGGPLATFVCVLALPIAIVLASWWRQLFHRVAIAAASGLQVVAIYIGGYRSIWLVLLIQVLIACVLGLKRQGVAVALLFLVVGVGGYQFIPNTSERAATGIAIFRGQRSDSSAADRQGRALGAINTVIESPLGTGWSTAGWTHSDFLQVAVNLGVVGGLIFLGGYVYTLLRLLRRVLPYLRMGEQGDLGFSLLLAFVGVGGLLAMEGVSVLPQLVLPSWFVWVLVEVWLRQTPDLREVRAAVATFHPNQLRQFDYPVGS